MTIFDAVRALAATVALAACGGVSALPQASPPRASAARYEGVVRYEARGPTPVGVSAAVTERPARFVRVLALAGDEQVLATAATDASGAFVLESPARAAHVVVVASIREGDIALDVTRDPNGTTPYLARVADPPLGTAMTLVARDEGEGLGGAFHILDTLYRGVTTARAWVDRPLPPLFAYWGRGITTSWSYYREERPPGSGRYAIELLGGPAGAQATTDTDEHDEAIVLHELGHFVMDRWSSDTSQGGDHAPGALLDPGLAWEEGRASWFAAAVLGAPYYWDTIGMEPRGSLRISHDVERGMRNVPKGHASEQSVTEILWDLSDGADGLRDDDADGVALGPAAVLRTMVELGAEPDRYPALAAFLRFAVARGLVAEAALDRMLEREGHDVTTRTAVWPTELALGSRVSGKVDGVTNPSPSGGEPRPAAGFDAVQTFIVRVARPGRLAVELRVEGSGRVRDRQDLDLEIRGPRADLLASSATEGAVERTSVQASPGIYVVVVRDGGAGNRAAFALTAALD